MAQNIVYQLIVSTDLANGIGKSWEKLLWHVPEELRHFKSLTLNHPVVMGRKTFETIGNPLPNRQNIILTRNKDFTADGCEIVHSIDELENLKLINNHVMIIGGLEIYKLFWDKASTICQSVIQRIEKDCDLFFPTVEIDKWKLEEIQPHVNFNFLVFTRVSK